MRLLWSLLKSPNPEVLNDMLHNTETSYFKMLFALQVQSCSAWAICPCIENMKVSQL